MSTTPMMPYEVPPRFGIDRLSSLPDEIIEQILSQIPDTEDVVFLTSILSKKFLNLSRRHQTIRLGSHLLFNDPNHPSIETYIASVQSHIATYRSPTVETLDLRLPPNHRARNLPANWLRFAETHSVRHLRLAALLLRKPKNTSVPDELYGPLGKNLLSLELVGCELPKFPLNFPRFTLLATLKICDIDISDETLSSLLSKCPLPPLPLPLLPPKPHRLPPLLPHPPPPCSTSRSPTATASSSPPSTPPTSNPSISWGRSGPSPSRTRLVSSMPPSGSTLIRGGRTSRLCYGGSGWYEKSATCPGRYESMSGSLNSAFFQGAHFHFSKT